jgi:hypothetical protein
MLHEQHSKGDFLNAILCYALFDLNPILEEDFLRRTYFFHSYRKASKNYERLLHKIYIITNSNNIAYIPTLYSLNIENPAK